MTGTFDDWASDRTALAPDSDGTTGTWSADVPGVAPGAEYQFTIRTADGDLWKMDPYARHVTNSVGNGIVYDPDGFDWGDDAFEMPTWDDLVIYEMHIGTFAATADRRGTFDDASAGGSPTSSGLAFRPSRSCRRSSSRATSRGATTRPTCSPSSPGYGGPDAFKRFIRDAHSHGIAVIVDVVYNHLGPVRPRPVAVRRLARGRRRRDLLLQRRAGPHAVGRHAAGLRPRRGPDVPARQRDEPGSRSSAATAFASIPPCTSGR